MAPMTNADESPTNRLTLFPIYLSLFVVSTLWRHVMKLKSKQSKNRIDVTSSANNSATTGPNLANDERQRENLLFVLTPYFQNYGAQSGLNYYNHRNQVPGFNYSVPEQILSSNLYQLHETSGTNQNMLLSISC